MQKILILIIGSYMIYLGVNGIITGQVSGLAGVTATSQALIDYDSHPILYPVIIIIKIMGGGYVIYLALFGRDNTE